MTIEGVKNAKILFKKYVIVLNKIKFDVLLREYFFYQQMKCNC